MLRIIVVVVCARKGRMGCWEVEREGALKVVDKSLRRFFASLVAGTNCYTTLILRY